MGGQNLSDTRNQPQESIINPSNVSQLAVRWSLPTKAGVEATPAVVNGVVYFEDRSGTFYAVSAASGQLLWSHLIADWSGLATDRSRGDPTVSGNTLYIGEQGGHYGTYVNGQLTGAGAKLLAVDTATGNLLWRTQLDPFALATVTSSPVVYNGVVYIATAVGPEEDISASAPSYPCCSGQGSVVALNAFSGQIIWQRSMLPALPSNPNGYSGASIWGSTPVVDSVRSQLYVTTGNNFWVPQDVQTCIGTARAMGQPLTVCDSVSNFAQDYADSIVALDLATGNIKWAYRADVYDVYNAGCSLMLGTCPSPRGNDTDFAAGPNLFTVTVNSNSVPAVGAGNKQGIYYVVNATNGKKLWSTRVGPGIGGRQWGTATDGQRIYMAFGGLQHKSYTLQPSGVTWNGGSWTALDVNSGQILWQTPTTGTCTNPKNGTTGGCGTEGPISLSNGVMYAGQINKAKGASTMFAFDASTGKVLWQFATGQIVHAAPAIVGNTVYWGSGYSPTTRSTFYAFTIPGT
jgi:polyvinyl alcohol dehydrogenase (cytochrome)